MYSVSEEILLHLDKNYIVNYKSEKSMYWYHIPTTLAPRINYGIGYDQVCWSVSEKISINNIDVIRLLVKIWTIQFLGFYPVNTNWWK